MVRCFWSAILASSPPLKLYQISPNAKTQSQTVEIAVPFSRAVLLSVPVGRWFDPFSDDVTKPDRTVIYPNPLRSINISKALPNFEVVRASRAVFNQYSNRR
jgi:hypothetical protein